MNTPCHGGDQKTTHLKRFKGATTDSNYNPFPIISEPDATQSVMGRPVKHPFKRGPQQTVITIYCPS